MSESKAHFWALTVVLAFLIQACGGPPTYITVATSPVLDPVQAVVLPQTPSPSALQLTVTPAMTLTATAVVRQTSSKVTISVINGNLYIRRGPDLGLNPISALMNGQTATALARDVLANWIQIRTPEDHKKTGWISIQTNYSVVTGDVMSLHEITPTEWPIPAYLRNCTTHQMEADPIGIVLPSLSYFPDNDVRINPGIYTVHDTDVDGSPEVQKVELKERSWIDIRVDGDGRMRKCQIPQ